MSSKVTVVLSLALSAVAAGVVFGGIRITLADTSGNPPAVETFTSAEVMVSPDGTVAQITAEFQDVAVGSFSVVATSFDEQGVDIPDFILSGSGTVPDTLPPPPPPPPPPVMIPKPNSMSITVG
jgi:hypothetical protein